MGNPRCSIMEHIQRNLIGLTQSVLDQQMMLGGTVEAFISVIQREKPVIMAEILLKQICL